MIGKTIQSDDSGDGFVFRLDPRLVDLNRKARFAASEGIKRELLWSTSHKIERLYQKALGERRGPPLIGNAWALANVPYCHTVGLFEVERWALGTEKVKQT